MCSERNEVEGQFHPLHSGFAYITFLSEELKKGIVVISATSIRSKGMKVFGIAHSATFFFATMEKVMTVFGNITSSMAHLCNRMFLALSTLFSYLHYSS